MRWKLRTVLLVVTVTCLVAARFSYLQTRYANLHRAGANIYYDWQNPIFREVSRIEVSRGDQSITSVEHRIDCTPKPRNWIGKLSSALVGDKAVAISITKDSLNSSVLNELVSIPTLDNILIIENRELTDPFELRDLDHSNLLTVQQSRSKVTKTLDGINVHWKTSFVDSR